MRKIFRLATILITSFVMALAGLVASPIASASENGNGSISATFPLGSSVLTKSQKAAIKKALASSGSDVSFVVTGTAGKLPGISDRRVQRLAKKRAQAIKAYLVSLGVSETRITTQTKFTAIGVRPKSTGSYPKSASTVAVTNSASTGSGGSSGGGGTPATTPGAPTSVSATAGNAESVVSWTAPTSNGGSAITGYTATSSPGSFTCTTASTSCTVTGLTNGSTYTFTVTATNSAGTGSASVASSSVTPITTPGAPTSVSATAGDTQSVVTWSAPTSNGGSAITGYTATSSPGSFTCTTASTSCTVTGLTNGSTYTFTVTATNSAGTGSASTSSSAITPLTCAAGGSCILGDTGPGGGIVYYVHTTTAGFNCGESYSPTGSPAGGLCKYLEVAPSGWNTGADPGKTWATGTSTTGNGILSVTGITEETTANNSSTGIGLGYKNSVEIVTQGNGTTTAAGAARAYTRTISTVTYSDWYLPTTAELTLLCQWNRGVTQNVTSVCTGGTLNTGTGTPSNRTAAAGSGFADTDNYWSSSQRSNANAWRQSFLDGSQPTGSKSLTDYVRPIRAF